MTLLWAQLAVVGGPTKGALHCTWQVVPGQRLSQAEASYLHSMPGSWKGAHSSRIWQPLSVVCIAHVAGSTVQSDLAMPMCVSAQ
jgi:hypothetical protein